MKIPVLLLLLSLSSCQRGMPEHGVWNGTLELPEGIILPFRMNLDLSGTKPTGHFLVGTEKTPIPEISIDNDSMIFAFSEYGAEMRGTWDGSQWNGLYLRHRTGSTKSFKFSASPESGLVPDTSEKESRFAAPLGDFQVHFAGENVADSTTSAKIWRDENWLYGTFIAPDGDYGLLAGMPSGERIQLNRFTGWQASVITLDLQAEVWSGAFHAASADKPLQFSLQARSNLQAEPPPKQQTAMKSPDSALEFSCTSLSGDTVRNTDERFKGKALVIDIMGTWCHNCLDEAPVLQQLQDEFGREGLEVVGLSFEITDDLELAKKNLNLYKDRFGLTTTLLFCGGVDEANLAKRIQSQLTNFFAFPTTLFIDRQGKVRAIHSGFRGPGTGDQFQLQVQEFHRLTSQLLN